MAVSVYSDAFSRLRQDLREEVREEALREGRQKVALKILGTVLEQDQLASLERAWQEADWLPDLDAVLAVRDRMQPWTSLFPAKTPSASDNGRHD